MRIALIAATLLIPLSIAASLTGSVVDPVGFSIAKANVGLDSGTQKYQTRTDDAGVYQFANLPAGDYTLTILVPGFRDLTIKSVKLLESEQKRIPEVTLLIGMICGVGHRDSVRLLPPGDSFGRLMGSVAPPLPDVEVTLICRTFSACRSTKTDSNGQFSFDMLSAGVYGLNFHREGFYPEIAIGYSYWVNDGLESTYYPKVLERCLNGNCDPKLRPKPPVAICE